MITYSAWLVLQDSHTQEILLGLRSPRVSHPNQWGLIGGKVDPPETKQKAIIRETKEEIGITISPDKLHLLGEMHRASFFHLLTRKGLVIPHLRIEAWEIAKIGWFTISEFPQKLHFSTITYLVLQNLATLKETS